jgi:hypothetical protein
MLSGANMDGLGVGAIRQLWLRFDMPPYTSSDENQRIQLTVTAVKGNTN